MSLDAIVTEVHDLLGTPAGSYGIGHWLLAEHGAPPRYVWVPSISRFDAPRSSSTGAARQPRDLLTHMLEVDVHVWADTLDNAIAQMHGVIAAVRQVCGNGIEIDRARWENAQVTDRGYLVVLGVAIPLVVSEAAITQLTTATVTAIGCDVTPPENADDGWIDCPCEEDEMAFATQHFNIGKMGAATVAASAGTPDVEALAVFGQLNVANQKTVQVIHLHGIDDKGSGSLTIEVFRRRDDVMTLLGSLTLTGGSGDYSTASLTPAGSLATLEPGDYLFAQLTAYTGSGGHDGITVDVHFA